MLWTFYAKPFLSLLMSVFLLVRNQCWPCSLSCNVNSTETDNSQYTCKTAQAPQNFRQVPLAIITERFPTYFPPMKELKTVPGHVKVGVLFLYRQQKEHPSLRRYWISGTVAVWYGFVTARIFLVVLPEWPSVRSLPPRYLCCCF